jgi:hypothetical protein
MNVGLSYLRWRASKKLLRVKRSVCRHLMRDDGGDSIPCILVAGAGRGGTTWVANVLAAGLHSRVLFEPFHPKVMRRVDRFHLYEYCRRDEPYEELQEFCSLLFSGKIRDAWIDRQSERLRPASRLVKTVRATLLLDWIDRHFPHVPKILVIRHPCAVTISRMRLAWKTDRDIEPLLAQQSLVDDFLADHVALIRSASSVEEKHAVIWCIQNLVPLAQLGPDRLHVLFYEDLVARPEATWGRVFRWLGQPFDASTLDIARRPSTTSTARSAVVQGDDPLTQWQRDLEPDQIARILDVVRGFGLDYLYGDTTTPLAAARERLRHPDAETFGYETARRSLQPLLRPGTASAQPEPHR